MNGAGQLIKEAFSAARGQPAASALTILMVAGMVVAGMLTTGRTVGAEQQVLASIDSTGTRSVIIRADDEAGISPLVIERIAHIDGIEWAGAFSNAIDATNTALPDGVRVPARYVYSENLSALGIQPDKVLDLQPSYPTDAARQRLGLAAVTGAITLVDSRSYAVVGVAKLPAYLHEFDPVVLIPGSRDSLGTVNIVVVIAAEPALVAPVTDAVVSLLGVEDTSQLSVRTGEGIAALRALIEGQLGTFSRELVIALLGVTGILVAALTFGLVLMHRKDFGRRRALGASRLFISGLVLCQTGLLSLVGAVLGAGAGGIAILVAGDPLPSVTFALALVILAIVVPPLAAIAPAVFASTREPIRELRVP